MSDVLEKPECQVLYRQLSVETRLSPIHLSEESSVSSDDENNTSLSESTTDKTYNNLERTKFQQELQKALSKPNNTTTKNYGEQNIQVRQPAELDTVEKTNTSERDRDFKRKLNDKIKMQQDDNISMKGTKPAVPSKPTKPAVPKTPALQTLSSGNSSYQYTPQEKNPCSDTSDNDLDDEEKSSVGLIKALNITKKVTRETVGQSEKKKEEMATANRPKSPRPVVIRGEKDESIWDKLGTLGRKKRIKEVQEVQAEGKYAIDSPGLSTAPAIPPEEYNLDDNEERCIIDPRAYDDPKFKDLLNVLQEWINDELASQRIIVQDLSEDLYDGQVLQKLLEKLTGDKLDVPEVTQSEEGQRQKLSVVLGHFNQVLGIQRISHNKWSVEAIHSKNIIAITHLLVALARHFRPPVRLPEHVSVDAIIVQKNKGLMNQKFVRENLTKAYDDVGMRCERDAFDTLFDHAPDKLQVVKKSLVTFVNKHLNKMNFEVTEIESQFHDGVYLIMLMGLLEGFFVPHYSFNLTPHEFDQKVHNVNFAFELMEEVGLQRPKARPEDVVNMDLKSTLRVLYNLFLKYKMIL